MANADVVRISDGHEDALAGFIRSVWDETATAEGVKASRSAAAAQNPLGAGIDIPAFAYISRGQIVGYVGTIPVRMWCEGREFHAHWMKGLMVLEQYRGGPVGYMVLREAIKHLDMAGSISVLPAARRLFEALGFADYGVINNYLLIVRPAEFLRKLDLDALSIQAIPQWILRASRHLQGRAASTIAGGAMQGALGLWKKCMTAAANDFRVEVGGIDVDIEENDRLWRNVRNEIGAGPIRDGRYVRWRYAKSGNGAYEVIRVYQDQELVGFGVVRRPREQGDARLRGIKVAVLSDLLFSASRPDVGVAIVAGAEQVAREHGADALLCSATHAAIRGTLRRGGYLNIPGNLHLLIRDESKRCIVSREVSRWWVTRGDGGADEVF